VAEAQAFIPGIETVTTKHGRGWNAAISMHPKRAADEIEAGVQRAVARRGQIGPLRFPEPLTFEIRFKRLEAAQAASRGLKAGERVDPYTVRWRLERLSDYF
jgi:D-amino peptidase